MFNRKLYERLDNMMNAYNATNARLREIQHTTSIEVKETEAKLVEADSTIAELKEELAVLRAEVENMQRPRRRADRRTTYKKYQRVLSTGLKRAK